MKSNNVLSTVSKGLVHLKVIVIGDVMLDRYIWGSVSRISPEAPVPVVHVRKTSKRGGGAANVALNLKGLGANVFLAGLTGMDSARDELLASLKKENVDTSLVIPVPDRPTITKTRIIGSHQQMIRLDEEESCLSPASQEKSFLEGILKVLEEGSFDVMILSDYAKGVLSSGVCQTLIKEANSKQIPVLVDPKGLDFTKYAGATLLTPNLKEISDVLQCAPDDLDALFPKAESLRTKLRIDNLMITRGEYGISLLTGDRKEIRHFPAQALEVFDVSGAGDTVLATVAGFITSGLSIDEVITLANVAAGVVVSKVGTVPIKRGELINALGTDSSSGSGSKIYDEAQLLHRIQEWKDRGEKIVFTNGCFDILHVGHVSYLEAAKKLGDRLIIGLNTDQSVKVLKGDDRPIVPEEDRARILAALSATDAVVLFDEETPLRLIESFQPDVLVKGSDYQEAGIVGAKEVRSWGGTVETVELVAGKSTTDIVSRINKVNR